MEDSKKRDKDMFTVFFLILYQLQINEMHQSYSMEGFGNILKDIRKMKVYFYLK